MNFELNINMNFKLNKIKNFKLSVIIDEIFSNFKQTQTERIRIITFTIGYQYAQCR